MILTFEECTVANGGGKAAGLGELVRAGIPVPDGFVIGADTYRQAVGALDVDALLESGGPASVRAAVEACPVPDDVRRSVADRLQEWGAGTALAVRSSATAEDLPDASFAGQQETYLGIVGVEAVIDAVRRCWGSLWSERATDYRSRAEFDHEAVALAVVVQRLVDADTAGVLFTVNPVSGADEAVINASWGLGESVVSGAVTPDEYRVLDSGAVETTIGTKATRIDRHDASTTTRPVPPDQQAVACLSQDQARELARMGTRVAEHFDCPMDIEWAYEGESLWLLQARPITTTAPAPTTPAAPTTTVSGRRLSRLSRVFHDDLVEHYPGPFPLDVAAIIRVHRQLQDGMAMIGIRSTPIDDLLSVDADGQVHVAYPDVRIGPGIVKAVRLKAPDPAQWPAVEEAYRVRLAANDRHALPSMESTALLDLLDDSLGLVEDVARVRFLDYVGPAQITGAKLAALLKASRRRDLTQFDLLGDLPFVTAVIDTELRRLAQLDPAGAEYADARAAFVDRLGARTTKLYLPFSNRSWREDPAALDATIDAVRRGGATDHTTEPYEELAAAIEESLPRPLRRSFRRTLQDWRAGHVAREASVYLIEDVFVRARAVTDELARRLHASGALSDAGDIRFLTLDEVREAVTTGVDPARTRDVVAHRRLHRAEAEASWWGARAASSGGAAGAITGTAGSPGMATGPVRIITGPTDFHRLEPGDVLVCQYTDPSWTPLFALAAAVVADTGGQLSHAAIVAREYGVPAVMGTHTATHSLSEGELVTVDGGRGTVVPHAAS